MINKIKIENIKEKYKSGQIRTTRLENYSIWKDETIKKIMSQIDILTSKEWSELRDREIHTLVEVRMYEYEIIWGPRDFIYKTDYNMYAWAVECQRKNKYQGGCQAIIFSGKGRGTDVEIILDKNDKPLGSVENFFYDYKSLMMFLKYGKIDDYQLFLQNPELYWISQKYNL